jgi:hypothetical protein
VTDFDFWGLEVFFLTSWKNRPKAWNHMFYCVAYTCQ